MDIFFVAAGPRYVRRRPGTTAVTAYPPALLLAASRASSITSASMSSMCSPISRAVAARSRPIVGAAAAASDSAPVPPDPSPGMSPRFRVGVHLQGQAQGGRHFRRLIPAARRRAQGVLRRRVGWRSTFLSAVSGATSWFRERTNQALSALNQKRDTKNGRRRQEAETHWGGPNSVHGD